MGRFRRDAVQLDDLEAAPLLQLVDRPHAHIESPEVEAFVRAPDPIERVLERGGEHRAAIKERCAAAMAATVAERHLLAV